MTPDVAGNGRPVPRVLPFVGRVGPLTPAANDNREPLGRRLRGVVVLAALLGALGTLAVLQLIGH